MKLFIKQHVFTWTDRFTVLDELGNNKYFVEGELFSWGKKLRVTNTANEEVIYIEQKLMSWLPKYYLSVYGRQVGELVKELTFLKPRYTVNGLGWNITGDFWAHEYVATRNNEQVLRISKEWLTWGDSYVIDIANDLEELPALAAILAIDCIMSNEADGS